LQQLGRGLGVEEQAVHFLLKHNPPKKQSHVPLPLNAACRRPSATRGGMRGVGGGVCVCVCVCVCGGGGGLHIRLHDALTARGLCEHVRGRHQLNGISATVLAAAACFCLVLYVSYCIPPH
jgi:hypothetical protein